MDRQRIVTAAAAGNVLVFAAVMVATGSAAAATRSTARYSGCVFALALLARSRWAAYPALLLGFVAAHFVHFSAVLYLAWVDAAMPLHRLVPTALLVTSFGFLLTASLGLTVPGLAAKERHPAVARYHAAAIYLVMAIFLLGFGGRARHSLPSAAAFAVVFTAAVAHFVHLQSLRAKGRTAGTDRRSEDSAARAVSR